MQSQEPLWQPTAAGVGEAAAPGAGGIVYLQPPTIQHDNYLRKQSIGLGAGQIVIGGLCILFNAITLGLSTSYSVGFVGHGFWCGILFIITGAFGISAGKSRTKCKIVAYMVLCIIAASFTAALLICGIYGAVINGSRSSYYCSNYGYHGYYYQPPCSAYTAIAALEGCMAVFGLIAASLFIWGSTLCCKSTPYCRCCSDDATGFPMVFVVNNGQPLQLVQPTMAYHPGGVAAPPPYQNTAFAQPYWVQAPTGHSTGVNTYNFIPADIAPESTKAGVP